jgi:predicted nucleotidyltransferase
MRDLSTQQKFAAALDALVERVKEDRSVVAAILCGSLSHDIVWAKSDIDLVFVTIDDKKVATSDLALYADGVNVHALLMPRTEFRKLVDGALHNSFMHSFLAKGRLLYSHDPTIADLCGRLRSIGGRDAALQLLRAATWALLPIDKAHKWFITRGDLDYTALWILYAATPLAQIELIRAGQLIDREVLPRATALNPDFFRAVYTDMLNQRKTAKSVAAALDAVDTYLARHAAAIFAPIIDYLREAGDIRSCKEIEHYFEQHFGIGGVTTACEYLADQGIIGKAGAPVHLTKKSNIELQELAFFHAAE